MQQTYFVAGSLRDDLVGRNVGRIFKCVRIRDQLPCVIKLVRSDEELRLHRLCADHPGVIRVLDAFRQPRILGKLYPRTTAVVLEAADRGDLLDFVTATGGLEEWLVWHLAEQLAHSLQPSHRLCLVA